MVYYTESVFSDKKRTVSFIKKYNKTNVRDEGWNKREEKLIGQRYSATQ